MLKRHLALWMAVLSLGATLSASAQEVSAPAATGVPAPQQKPTESQRSATGADASPEPSPQTLREQPLSPPPANPQPSPGSQQIGALPEADRDNRDKKELLDIAGLPLARLIEQNNVFSGLGTFKQLLPKYGIASYIHGTTLVNLIGQTAQEPAVLNDHEGQNNPRIGAEFNLFIGAELMNRVFIEAQVIFDATRGEFGSDYSQIDIRVYRDLLFLRGGKFWVPMGGINVYPDPLYIFPTPDLPLFMGNVLPGEWGELGFQLYGRYSWGEGRGLSYAFYVVNGLEQRVVNPGDPISGGSLRYMLNNNSDLNDVDKAVGAQVVLEPIPGLSFGLSGYEGVYTITGKHRIYIADAHMAWKRGRFTLRGEMATTIQETEGDTLLKIGGFALASYRFKYLEPLVMFDGIRLDGSHELDRVEPTLGLIYYPFPMKVPTASARVTYAPRWRTDTGELATHHFALEIRAAF